MSVNGISSLSTSPSSAVNPNDAVGLTVFKKALDSEASTALSLIDSATLSTPTSSTTNLPPNLGQNVDTTA
jgi:hypothetical protein